MVDGKFILDSADGAAPKQREAGIPLIIGSNSLESAVWSFEPSLGLVQLMPAPSEEELLPCMTSERRKQFVARHLPAAKGDRAAALAMLSTASNFGLAARDVAAANAKTSNSYLYRFEAVPTPGRATSAGSPHGTDIFYIFSSLDKFRSHPEQMSDADWHVASMMTDYWASFARTGVPQSVGGPRWKRYESSDDTLLLVTNAGASNAHIPNLDVLEELREAQRAGLPCRLKH